jgi:hypothetical protein
VPPPDQPLSPLALPVNLEDQLQFLSYELRTPATNPDHVSLLTLWRVTAPPDGPRAFFVHLLTPDGQVATQWDGLDVPVEGWREGDTLLQTASFDLPPDLPPGQHWLQTGVYNPATLERLPVSAEGKLITDRILLTHITRSK